MARLVDLSISAMLAAPASVSRLRVAGSPSRQMRPPGWHLSAASFALLQAQQAHPRAPLQCPWLCPSGSSPRTSRRPPSSCWSSSLAASSRRWAWLPGTSWARRSEGTACACARVHCRSDASLRWPANPACQVLCWPSARTNPLPRLSPTLVHPCGTRRYVGANQMMEETLHLFLDPRYGIKESQALSRIPETLVCAMEFITLPSPAVSGLQMAAAHACHALLCAGRPAWRRFKWGGVAWRCHPYSIVDQLPSTPVLAASGPGARFGRAAQDGAAAAPRPEGQERFLEAAHLGAEGLLGLSGRGPPCIARSPVIQRVLRIVSMWRRCPPVCQKHVPRPFADLVLWLQPLCPTAAMNTLLAGAHAAAGVPVAGGHPRPAAEGPQLCAGQGPAAAARDARHSHSAPHAGTHLPGLPAWVRVSVVRSGWADWLPFALWALLGPRCRRCITKSVGACLISRADFLRAPACTNSAFRPCPPSCSPTTGGSPLRLAASS